MNNLLPPVYLTGDDSTGHRKVLKNPVGVVEYRYESEDRKQIITQPERAEVLNYPAG